LAGWGLPGSLFSEATGNDKEKHDYLTSQQTERESKKNAASQAGSQEAGMKDGAEGGQNV
jgi:hypothetical protein